MGDIFQGIKGNLNGFGLENSDFDPLDDSRDEVDAFFNDDFGEEVINKKAIKKSKKIAQDISESDIFGGF
ncbi:MAG: hypothetical protein GTN97_08630 [Nitrosopumilaceae archaeon]|nr:hypothetical protein [Nitrosopumilaceae archaeon]